MSDTNHPSRESREKSVEQVRKWRDQFREQHVINSDTELSISLVNIFFKNRKKSVKWMEIANPLLGGLKPIEMVQRGRTEKLHAWILGQLRNNRNG